MANYSPNEVVDILLTLGEWNKNYRRTSRHYADLYPNRRHPNIRQVINIEKKELAEIHYIVRNR